MSRTIRKHLDGEYIIQGQIIHWDDPIMDQFRWPHPGSTMGFKYRQRIIKQRDRKPWGKPPKWFKKMYRRIERAQVNHAVRTGKEIIPIFKKTDRWNWT